jgi:hypothetical protein
MGKLLPCLAGGKLPAVDESQADLPAKAGITTAQTMSDADARLASRLKQFLHTLGISDKDRKLVEGNLQRLVASGSAVPRT